MRVSAVNGMTSRHAERSIVALDALLHLLGQRRRCDRPRASRRASEDEQAASARSRSVAPPTGTISAASRLPKVIVPVLSSSSISTSPAASTARPDIASTLKRVTRSMPAMPIAESSPPIVVGIRHTSSAIRIDRRDRRCPRRSRTAPA